MRLLVLMRQEANSAVRVSRKALFTLRRRRKNELFFLLLDLVSAHDA